MSRIGKKVIQIPEQVKLSKDEKFIKIEGPKGKLEHEINDNFDYILEANTLKIVPKIELKDKKIKARYGLERALLQNKIIGVLNGYSKALILQGTGYKVQLQGNKLVFSVGFSHPVVYEAPKEVKVEIEDLPNKTTKIKVSGIDKSIVGLVAAEIRKIKPVEPYQGKGIFYEGERIRRKVGKSVVGSGAGGK